MRARYIHSLLTLGMTATNAPGPLFDSLCGNLSTEKVLSLAAVGMGFKGTNWRSLTEDLYTFCIGIKGYFMKRYSCWECITSVRMIYLHYLMMGL